MSQLVSEKRKTRIAAGPLRYRIFPGDIAADIAAQLAEYPGGFVPPSIVSKYRYRSSNFCERFFNSMVGLRLCALYKSAHRRAPQTRTFYDFGGVSAMKMVAAVAVVVGAALYAAPAVSSLTPTDTDLNPNQVRYAYVEPTNPAHRPIYDRLKELRFLERLSDFLSPLRLPRTLTEKVQGCDGRVNSYYWDYNVMVCYEYLDFMLKSVPADFKNSDEMTRHDALLGMTLDVLLHETGHAVFDMLQIPFMGHEEDAADQFASYIELQFAKPDARRLILGVAFLARDQAKEELDRTPAAREFADVHGTPTQRYFNVLCMAYGSDPDLFADAMTRGLLQRAKTCHYEYERYGFAFHTLIEPYIDQTLLQQVKAKSWFRWDAMKSGSQHTEADGHK